MKNSNQYPAMLNVVKASITTIIEKGFCFILVFNILLMLSLTGKAQFKGGKMEVAPGPLGTATIKTVNVTGEKLCDFWIKYTGVAKVKSISVNGAKIVPKNKENGKEHVIINSCIADKGAINIEISFEANITNLYLVPTDSMHSDLLVDKNVNPNIGDLARLAEKTTLPGGTKSPTFESSKFPSLGYVNNTATDICDLRIESTQLIDSVFINNKKPDSTYAANKKVAPDKSANNNVVHVYFPCVAKGESFKVSVAMKGEVATYKITPTDSINADIMINNEINPNLQQNGKAKPTNTSGGKQKVTYDPSKFPSMDFVNETGTDICDLRIEAPGTSKIQEVYVNDKKVDSAYVGGVKKNPPYNAGAVHVFFPCIAKDGKYRVSVKFAGETSTYTYLPTDSLNADIATGIQNIHPGDKSSRKITFPGVTPGSTTSSNKSSTVFVNDTKEDICDLEIIAAQNIAEVRVNGVVWPTNPAGQVGKKVKVNAPAGACAAVGSKFVVTITIAGGKKIDGYEINFTNSDHEMIYVCNFTGGMNSFLMPNVNSAFGLSGRSGSLVAINESCSPISQLVFNSPNPGVDVINAGSSDPYTFDNFTNTLFFNNPVLPGSIINFNFEINGLLPYVPTDTFPYTKIEVTVPGISTSFDGFGQVVPATGFTETNGSIDFTLTGGMINPVFLWSNGNTTEDISNLATGTYTVNVSSPSGCMMKVFDVPVEAPDPILPLTYVLDLVSINPWCTGTASGSAMVMNNDSTNSLVFMWSNGVTTAVNNNLGVGSYTVNVFYPNGASWAGTVTLIEPPLPVAVNGIVNNLNCYKDKTGSIVINPSGGTPPYLYQWNNGNTNQNRFNLNAGTYTVIVKDGFGCTATLSKKVKQPAQLVTSVTGTNAPCADGTGTGTVSASGGTLPYQYNWSNGANTPTAVLPAGINSVTVIDGHGCTSASTLIINAPPPIMINVMPVAPGQAIAQVTGGTPPYSFMWNTMPVQTTAMATGLQQNQMYTVMVIDAQGCAQTANFIMPLMRMADGSNDLKVVAYPNPTNGSFTVDFGPSNNEDYQIELCDATGRIVYSENSNKQLVPIDLTGMANGVYTLKVSNSIAKEMIRIVLNR